MIISVRLERRGMSGRSRSGEEGRVSDRRSPSGAGDGSDGRWWCSSGDELVSGAVNDEARRSGTAGGAMDGERDIDARARSAADRSANERASCPPTIDALRGGAGGRIDPSSVGEIAGAAESEPRIDAECGGWMSERRPEPDAGPDMDAGYEALRFCACHRSRADSSVSRPDCGWSERRRLASWSSDGAMGNEWERRAPTGNEPEPWRSRSRSRSRSNSHHPPKCESDIAEKLEPREE
jgi:hypothetical protein